MARASGARVEIAYKKETVPGTTPVPLDSGWLAIRKNSETLEGKSDVIESGEIRADRESASDVQGNKNVLGGIETEFSALSHDDLIASAMFNPWTATNVAATDLDMDNSDNSINRVAGSFVTDGFVIGQWIKIAGFSTNAVNNAWAKVVSVVALKMVLAGVTVVTETGSGDETIDASYIKGGVAAQYLSMRKAYRDIDDAIVFAGLLLDMNVSMAPNQVVTLGFTANGRTETGQADAGTVASDVATGDPFDSFSGMVLLDNVENVNMTSIDVAIANNLDDMFVVGSRFKTDVTPGRRAVSGNVGFYFETLDEYNDSVAHAAKSIDLSTSDGTDFYAITLPRTYYDLGTPQTNGEGAMSMSGALRAKLDAVTGTSVIISRST